MSESTVQIIPQSLIYEMDDGQPIYYRGYQDYLSGKKQLEELMGSSILQSLLVTELVYFLKSALGKKYQVLTNELGLQFKKKSWRAADIAICRKSDLQTVALDNKYLSVPPKIVIEIDTKADLNEIPDSFSYYQKKTDQLLDFGVEKVIWVFTDTKKVMIAEPDQDWKISPWDKGVQVLDDITVTLQKLIEEAS
ncbi:MAG: Uma2 family endonuclease [Bacteroidota bacterium]